MSDHGFGASESVDGVWPAEIEAAQRWVCERYGAGFDPITDESLVSLDPIIMEPSINVEGSRYLMTGPMSGWILIGERFAGGVADLRIEHARHVVDARPDLARYFALPVGWRFFRTSVGENVYLIDSDIGDEAG